MDGNKFNTRCREAGEQRLEILDECEVRDGGPSHACAAAGSLWAGGLATVVAAPLAASGGRCMASPGWLRRAQHTCKQLEQP